MGKTRKKKEREGEAVSGSIDGTWIKIYDARGKYADQTNPDTPEVLGIGRPTPKPKQKPVFTGPNLWILYPISYWIPYNVPELLQWHESPFKIRKKVLFFLSFIVEDYNKWHAIATIISP